jgi:threonine/homoserine/homoserine lactone efflux protein
MPASELTALLLFATAMSFSPGPNNTLSAALAANHGLAHAMRFVCAVPVGWGLLLLGCAVGLGGLIQALPVLHGVIKWVGLAYMLWLASKLWRSDRLAQAGASSGLDVSFGQGVLLQFVNVKAWLNALLVSAGWIATADNRVERLLIVLPLMMGYGLASNFSYALAGSALRGWLAVGRRLVMFNRLLASVLVATVVWMATL